MSDLPIRPYVREAASFNAWDPGTQAVAGHVARLVESACSVAMVEHIGSTAVPGLRGKNIVDLAIEAVPDDIPALSDALGSLGFGRQEGIAPFPPTRPMFTGTVTEAGVQYRVHLHVVPPARGELAELRAFRDALRADESLRDAYAAEKRRLVDEGPAGPANELYTARKGGFVVDSLYRLGIRLPPADRPEPLAPGSTIGIMGGGQLGRMLALAARTIGYRIVVLDPDPGCPAASVADEVIVGRYDDVEAARRLGEASDVVTYELEHVGMDAATAAADGAPLRPGARALRATQDRLAERRFIREIGEYTAPWREVRGIPETIAAAEALGYPCRLKRPLGGYDGRSQLRIDSPSEVAAAVHALGDDEHAPLLLEAEIDFEGELSCVIARDRDGRTLAFPPSANVHEAGILIESVAPATVDPLQAYDAMEIAERLARSLDLVGVLTVELFRLRGGGLMINELAPRVHNSGHWTLEGAATSQFEQHVRAIAGLPLGSVAPHGVAAMVNILGTGPDREARLAGLPDALRDPGVHVHVYDKRRVFERRKMGHVTVVGSDVDEVVERARRAREALRWEV